MLKVRPLTPNLWPALEDLFGPRGATDGCWCMYWRLGKEYKRERSKNKSAFRRIVKRGPPPGLLAFEGDVAVGWCQLTPRSDLPILDQRRVSARVDDVPVWSLSCFYVRKGYRRNGIVSALIAAAVKEAKRAKAPALEAYPYVTRQPVYVGLLSTFKRAGFEVVARTTPSRAIVRHSLEG
jgi:ribosomal protein S18 acetylase RimI-like enzyme